MAGAIKASRWTAFGDAVALVLGLNTWATLALLPALYESGPRGHLFLLAALSLGVLLAGAHMRSALLLLLGFPLALLLPVALSPASTDILFHNAWRFALVQAGTVAYLLAAAALATRRAPATPESSRLLSSAKRPRKASQKRRRRVYAYLAVASAVIPYCLFHRLNFDEGTQLFLRETFPGRFAAVSVVLNLAVVAGWAALFRLVWLGTLIPHRTGDRALQKRLAALRVPTPIWQRPGIWLALVTLLAAGAAILAFPEGGGVP